MAHTGLHVALQCTAPVPLEAEVDCAPGELVALVGPSGSGKTTLLRAIAGLYTSPHLQGSVSLGQGDGADRWFDSQRGINLAPQARRAGLVFQQYALFPHLSAIDNIAICLYSTSGKALKNKQAMALLKRVDMQSLAHRLPHQLSGGQQQRVAIARALARLLPQHSGAHHGAHNDEKVAAQPAAQRGVLLLDEPFSAVDAPTRQLLYRSVAQLRATLALPIILVTHDLSEARRLADRVVIIDCGVTLQSGPPERVLRSPRNARVAQLVGIHNHFAGQFYGSGQPAPAATPSRALGQLHWGAHRLRAPDKGKIDSGTDVTWVLAGDSVQLLAAGNDGAEDANSQDTAADNYLACQLTEMLPLGEICVCQLTVHGAPAGDSISLNLSTALLRSLGAQVGSALRLHVPPEALHIMPVREMNA